MPASIVIQTRKKWKITQRNLKAFSDNIAPSTLIRPNDIDSVAEDFVKRLYDSAEIEIERTTGKMKTTKCAHWWDEECAMKVKQRNKAWKNLIRNPSTDNIQKYRDLRNDCKKMMKIKKNDSFKEFISDINFDTPPVEVWGKVRAIRGYNYPEAVPFQNQGNLIVDSADKANLIAINLLNQTMGVEHALTGYTNMVTNAAKQSDHSLDSDITMCELKAALNQTKNSSPGSDEISYSMLKALNSNEIDELLALLNQSWQTGNIPKSWKTGTVIPILKPRKPKDQASSYRPITLLSCISKTLERIVKNRLEHKVEMEKLLLDSQCGFRRGQGTIDALMRLENEIRSGQSSHKVCLVTYIDLARAFDTVWREGLIAKLIGMGFRGNLVRWLDNYFQDREIKVYHEGVYSNSFSLEAGTPQGAVLSPILFNLMLSDIPKDLNVSLYIYADDITISCSNTDAELAKSNMQQYVNKFTDWCKVWKLTVNPLKTTMQYFTKKKVNCPIIRLENQVITYKKDQKILGLIFDSPNLTWKSHIEYLKRDCMKRVDLLKVFASPSWGASTLILKNFYIAYVRSKIDYACVLYGSASKTYLKKLDPIQNSAMRLILGARNTTPILSLQAESLIPPLALHRDYLNVKHFIKLKHKPKCYPTTTILKIDHKKNDYNKYPFQSFCNRACKSLRNYDMCSLKRITTEIFMNPSLIQKDSNIILSFDATVNNEELFQNYVNTHYPDFTLIFTDGSKKLDDGEPSCAAAVFFPADKKTTCWKLRGEHSVISAELFAIWRALLLIKTMDDRKLILFTDSKSSLQLISAQPQTYHSTVFAIQNLLHELEISQKIVYLHWIKSHCGIMGNEIADKGALKGHENLKSELYELTYDENISILKQKFKIYWNDYWKVTCDMNGTGQFLRSIRENVFESQPVVKFKKHRHETVIFRMRMGHAGTKQYLHRFGMADSELCQNCNVPETISHFLLECPVHSDQRDIMFNKLRAIGVMNPSIKVILGGDENLKRLCHDIFKYLIEYVISTDMLCVL